LRKSDLPEGREKIAPGHFSGQPEAAIKSGLERNFSSIPTTKIC
jgi:hypothetical protein